MTDQACIQTNHFSGGTSLLEFYWPGEGSKGKGCLPFQNCLRFSRVPSDAKWCKISLYFLPVFVFVIENTVGGTFLRTEPLYVTIASWSFT